MTCHSAVSYFAQGDTNQNLTMDFADCIILAFTEYRDDVFDFDDEEPVVAFEIDGDSAFGVEEYFVVLLEWNLGGHFDFSRDGHNSPGDGGDFDVVGQLDAAFGLLFVFVLADENALADRFDGFKYVSF